MVYETYKIADLIDEIAMGPFGSNIKVECFVDEGIPVLNGSNLDGFALSEKEFRYVTLEKADSLKKANASRGDVVITHRGTLGQIVYIPQNSKYDRYVISQSQFRVRCNDKILPEYMVYYFHTAVGQHKLLSNASQVGVPALARPSSTFQQIEIEVPSIQVQRRVVSIINALQSKIDCNNMINDNLQQQAHSLFEQRFVWSGLDGEEKPLYDFADYINGAAFKPSECGDHGLPIIRIAELKNGITDSTRYFDGFKGEKYLIRDKDILFSWSGNPDTSIDIFIWTHGDAILNQHTFNVKSYTGHRWFTYLLLKYFKPEFSRIASNKQTTGLGHVTASDLKRLTFNYNKAAIEAFEDEISPLMNMVYNNMIENLRLAQLRDCLLPKLMSGELDVSTIQL